MEIIEPKEKVERMLYAYFAGQEAEIQVCMYGRMADVEVQYTDFKPVDMVRRELEGLIPNLCRIQIDRINSDDLYISVLHDMMDDESVIYIPMEDGKVEKTTISAYIEERAWRKLKIEN